MGTRAAIAIGAVVGGGLLAVLLFVPYVARQYRRRGRLAVGRAVLSGAWLVYLVALVGYVLLPLPTDVAALCARGGVRPQLRPFYVLGDLGRGRTGTGLVSWLSSPPLVPLLFNVVLFVPLGMLVRHLFGCRRLVTVAIGLGVSVLVECTQLTGNWFLYPCAYRQFNVDDLIANTAGTAIGVLLAPVLRLIDRDRTTGPDRPAPVVTARRRWLGMGCDAVACGVLGMFLATLVPELDLLITGHYPTDSDTWYPYLEVALAWWVPGALLFVLPSLIGIGGSIGQRTVLLCPVLGDGNRPTARQRLGRVLFGSGLYALLGGVVALGVDPTYLSPLVLVCFVVASVVAVGPTRSHQGLSGVLTGLDFADRQGLSMSPEHDT